MYGASVGRRASTRPDLFVCLLVCGGGHCVPSKARLSPRDKPGPSGGIVFVLLCKSEFKC